jgi:thiamine-phosphate pyrophosphorylase
MASRQQPAATRRPAPRLYLVTPQDCTGVADQLASALAAANVAAVLVRLPEGGERAQIDHAKMLAALVQNRGVALLLDGHADLVAPAGADGAHLTGLDSFEAAFMTLKPERIAGCGGLATRHDAMVAAESGADYIMFGEPDAAGRRPAFSAVLERVAWWAELIEVPCVGFAAAPEEVGPLGAAGADFVALGPWVFADSRGAEAAAAAAGREIAGVEVVA